MKSLRRAKRDSTNRRVRTRRSSAAQQAYATDSRAEATPRDRLAIGLAPAAGQLEHLLRRSGLIVFALAIALSAYQILTLSPAVKIVRLQTADISTTDTSAYQEAANTFLKASPLNRTKLTANTRGLSTALLHQFPELASVNVVLPLIGHRPVVYIAAAQPSLVLQAGNGSFILDDRGRALLPASGLPAEQVRTLATISDQSGLQVQLNRQIITPGNVHFIRDIETQLSARGYVISSLTLPPAANELDVHLVGQPYFIKFNLQSDSARQQAGTFLATANYLKKQNIVPGEYFDVRVDGRAYYR